MIIFPAIDIKEGKVVRLIQGKFDQVTDYGLDPVTVAQEWEKQGAQWIHVVDLDGAQTGEPKNLEIIFKIVKNVKIPVQVGGGIRQETTIEKLFKNNVARVVLGTKAVKNLSFLKEILKRHGNKIAVSLDCSQGFVQTKGWTQGSNVQAIPFCSELEKAGLQCLVYTDISRDGMLQGPNFTGLTELLNKTKISVIASGGVSSIDDIKKLKALRPAPMGVIIGKALYEGKINLKEAIRLCSQKE